MINKRSMIYGISLIMIVSCIDTIIALFYNFDGGLALITLVTTLIGIGLGLFTLFSNNKITLILTLVFSIISFVISNIIHRAFSGGYIFYIIFILLQYIIMIGGVAATFILKDQVDEEHPGLSKALAMAKGFTIFNIVYAFNYILGQLSSLFMLGMRNGIPSMIIIVFAIFIIIFSFITLSQEDKFTGNYIAASFFIFNAAMLVFNLLFSSLRGYTYYGPGIYLGYGISIVYYIILAIGNIMSSNKAKNAYYYAYYLGNGAQQSQPMNPNVLNQPRPIIQPNGYQPVNNQPQPPVNNPQVGQMPVNNPQVGQTPVRPTYENNDQQIDHQFDDHNDWN